MKKFVAAGDLRIDSKLPYLAQSSHIVTMRRKDSDGMKVQGDLLQKLKDFRQNRANRGSKVPGRSYWPEPDAIRKMYSDEATQKRNRKVSAERDEPMHSPAISKFPRAEFGLPIIFEMRHDKSIPTPTLSGASKQQSRMASPLIFRPLRSADVYVGIAFY